MAFSSNAAEEAVKQLHATVTEMAAEIRALNSITAERFAALKDRLDRERREDQNN